MPPRSSATSSAATCGFRRGAKVRWAGYSSTSCTTLRLPSLSHDNAQVDASELAFDGTKSSRSGSNRDFDDVIREHPSVFGEAVQ